jgi:ribosomal protein S10
MGKMVVTIFELPQKLGIIQQVEYDPSPREQCAANVCLYEGILTAEGCRRGVCVRYRVRVRSKDRRTWETREFRRVRPADRGGCITQAMADALWELASRFEVGLWYELHYMPCGFKDCTPILRGVSCGPIVNGIRLPMLYCDAVDKCVEKILEDYKREVEKLRGPPIVSPHKAEELLKKYPELEAFGVEWVRAWAPHARDRLVEIAEVMRKYPWMAEVVKKRPLSNLNPYTVEVYVAKDSSVVCLSLDQLRYCAQNGAVRAVKLGLEFSRYEVYEGKKWAVYRPKGLLTFTAVGKEYVKIL